MNKGKDTKKPAAEKPQVVDVPASKCKALKENGETCGSTRRADYHNVTRAAHAGELPDGTPYDVVVFRRTKCLDCGQARVDRTFEMASDDDLEAEA